MGILEELGGLASQVLDQSSDLSFGFKGSSGDFLVLGFEGFEAISQDFEITVDLIAQSASLDLHALLDTPAALGLYHKYDQPRYLHGIITEIEKGRSGFARTFYRATLRPTFHRLHFITDNRIFQEKSVPDISKELLAEYGITNLEWRLEMEHGVREYCVQYAESVHTFLSRLWAEEGMFYWFEHSKAGHKMIILDAPLGMLLLKAAPMLAYNNLPGGSSKGFCVSSFEQVERLRSTARVSADYCFKQPASHQRQTVGQYAANGAKGKYEQYHYPRRHKTDAVGRPFNDYALQARRVDATTGRGETNAIQLSAGYVLGLKDHPDMGANCNHRLLEVHHRGEQPAALEEEAPLDGATTYGAQFISQPARIPYRALVPRLKPMIEGPQIAHVTGPSGEEIYCDEHGRVKIWFPWDRLGKKDEHSSCWVRVSQGWAGGSWGHMAIPRIGQEVIVDFLEGDPDQPIVTGRTYHATNKTPYKLPDNKTRMTIKSQTHKGKGYNELRFEDEANKEEVFMHAQKDHNTIIENDETHHIKHDRAKTVDNDQSETIGVNKSIQVGSNHNESIGSNKTLNVGGDHTETINKNMIVSVLMNLMKNIAITETKTVGVAQIKNIGATQQTNVGKQKKTVVGEEYVIEVGKSKLIMKKDGTVRILGNNLDITMDGPVQINGKTVDLN